MESQTSKGSFYITTTLPYVNAEPHLGHAMEFIRADVVARHKKLQGFDVFFNTGTDEHGMKLYEGAKNEGKTEHEYVDFYAGKVKELLKLLGVSEDVHFIRTTDLRHIEATKAFWNKVSENGYIYKKNYKAKYCVGCEEEKTDSDLVDGKCPIHSNRELEIIEEENYFFKYSAFQEKLTKFYEENPTFVIPDFRLNEMKEFVKGGLQDFSISRLKTKMPWGIEVPGDPDHIMYVWFDALINYIATLGYPNLDGDFKKYWVEGETVQYC
jgi:methionyl-tRNA synthetase